MLWDCFEQPLKFSNQWLVPMLTRLRTNDLPAWREERGEERRERQRGGKKGEAEGKDRGEERRERPEGRTEGRKGGGKEEIHLGTCILK